MNKLLLPALAAAACAALPAPAPAATVVAPNGLADTLGNGQDNGDDVFGRPGTTDGNRYQQVYNADQFGALAGTENITEVAFRAKQSLAFLGNAYTISDVTIQLSTTDRASALGVPNGISNTFADNIGLDVQTVYSGPLTITTATGGTTDFGFVIDLQSPFAYTPADGNLLLDITVPDGASVVEAGAFGASSFDTQTGQALPPDNDDGIASARGSTADQPLGSNSTTGLVTQFTTVAVPEPAALGLLGMAGVGLLRRRA